MENIATNRRNDIIKDIIFVVMVVTILITLQNENFLLFHCSVEIFGAFIGTGILLVAASLLKPFKNYFFMIMGVGYLLVGILDILHAFSYNGMDIIAGASMNLVCQLWIAARILEFFTMVSAIIILNIKKPNYIISSSILMIIFIILILDILYFKNFPVCFNNSEATGFKFDMERIIVCGLILSAFLLYKVRKSIDQNLYFYLMISIFLKILSEACFVTSNSLPLLLSHTLKFMSFYFMYKGVIVNGIQRPYEMLVLDLKKAGKNLESEIQLRSIMEEVISKNEQCIDLFINKSSDGIIVEKGQNLIYVNSKAANILGADNILDLYNNESFSEDFKRLTLKQREFAMQHKSEMPFAEYQLKTCDGETIDIECSTNYIIYGGAPALMHMFRDISHRKKITSLEMDIRSTELKLYQSNELNRVLTEFFSNVSHELRTPLNIISSASQLLQHCNPDKSKEKTNNLLNIINQNTFRLIRIINNLIDVSKYDSGYLNLNLRNYNIVTMIEDITLSVVEYANIKGLEIVFDTDVEEKIMAVDDDKIERIMLNLISNSIKFTNKGGKIMVSLEDKDEQLRITVKDTGIGIPKDKIDLIFERFGQVDKSLKRNREGSGIGLSLVKTFVQMHGGNIYVNSKYNKGSEFVIDLPVKTVEDNGKIDYSIGNKVEKIKIEFSDIYPDSLPLSS